MALGKRKRDVTVARRSRHEVEEDFHDTRPVSETHDVFRKHFESYFEPLPEPATIASSSGTEGSANSEDEDVEEDEQMEQSDFGGFSDDETQGPDVEVIEVGDTTTQHENVMDKIFKKSFMTSRPPRDLTGTQLQPQSIKSRDDDSDADEEEATNLKHDLDLQRLLRESHLLSQSRSQMQSTSLSTTGTQRHQATDLQLRDLGSKSSLYTQAKMPMAHRKGISTKSATKELQRRRDAKENGIILEKEHNKSARRRAGVIATRRDRGVDVPVLGRFRGGTLSLSKSDIASIQGPNLRGGKGAGKKHGRRSR